MSHLVTLLFRKAIFDFFVHIQKIVYFLPKSLDTCKLFKMLNFFVSTLSSYESTFFDFSASTLLKLFMISSLLKLFMISSMSMLSNVSEIFHACSYHANFLVYLSRCCYFWH